MQFLYSHWMKLNMTMRNQLAQAFGISKTSSTHIANDLIVSDGYKIQDVEAAMSIDNLQRYLNTSETDFSILWDNLLAKAEGRENTTKNEINIPVKLEVDVASYKNVVGSNGTSEVFEEEIVKDTIEPPKEIKPAPKKRARKKTGK